MAGGWAPDGAVNDQIEASIQDELKRMQQRPVPQGEGLTHCAECEEEIPEARRRAIPGVKLCVDCQSARDSRPVMRGGINRSGSKDTQLK
jgi:phage/conjugal plasmid C-4 type zinc finger TraR family protein